MILEADKENFIMAASCYPEDKDHAKMIKKMSLSNYFYYIYFIV